MTNFFSRFSRKQEFRNVDNRNRKAYEMQENAYRIEVVEHPDQGAWRVIGRGLHDFNLAATGDDRTQELCLALYDDQNEIAGGVISEIYWGWYYINVLWVKSELRGCGFGRKLLIQAENEAKKMGAKNVYLDTFSFQAPEFYKKNGYHVFGELNNFPEGFQRYFFTKEL